MPGAEVDSTHAIIVSPYEDLKLRRP